jgi:hypothetical protein
MRGSYSSAVLENTWEQVEAVWTRKGGECSTVEEQRVLSMVMCACNLSTQEAEAGGVCV